jgi:hypothetical protein
MPGPLIFIGTHTIQDGKIEIAKRASRELVEFLEANHPREIHFQISIDDDAHEMRVIQIHPDDESLLFHVQVAGERIAAAYEFLDATISIEIYGTPSEELSQLAHKMAMGAPLRINTAEAGFSRLNQAAI